MHVDHLQRSVTFSGAARLAQARLNDQTRTVLHQGMAHETEPRLLAVTLLEQLGVRIGG